MGPGFCDVDSETRTMFQKDSWAFDQLDKEFLKPQVLALPSKPLRLTRGKKAVVTSVVPVIQAPVIHKFTKDTAYCTVKITVTDKHGSFNFNVQSDAPVVGWEINTQQKEMVKSGDANQMYVFGVDVNQNFTNNLVLTLFIFKDNQTNPIFINLF